MNSTIIYEWDWRYKIGLVPEIHSSVPESISRLDTEKQVIYKSIIDFYNAYISFEMILEVCSHDKTQLLNISNNAEIISKKLIGIPPILQNGIKDKLDNLMEKNPNNKKYMYDLFNIACNSTRYANISELFTSIFGPYYNELINVNFSNISKKQNSSTINPEDLTKKIKGFILSSTNDEIVTTRFGEFAISNYKTEIVEQSIGFAEWWAKELTEENEDKLVIYKNKDSLNPLDLELTIYHEIYPGHGHFYDLARKANHKFFDHGALCLIEGWATYCEWNTVHNSYTEYLRDRSIQIIQQTCSNNLSHHEAVEQLYKKLLENSSEEQALNSLLYFSQYPGFYESYVLGSLWIEQRINDGLYKQPIDFLESLQNNDWGDFFALWK